MLGSAFERHPSILFGGVALMSAAAGLMLAGGGQEGLPLPLIALAGLTLILLMISVPPPLLFTGWLFLAPLLANATASPIGKPLGLALYALPGLVLAIVTVTHLEGRDALSFADFLPAAYVAYALVSIAVTTPALEPTTMRSVEVVFLNVVLGPCLYYFLVVGPGRTVHATTMLLVLMIGACIQGVLALFEAATAWNLWGYYDWSNSDREIGRVVSTFSNPGVLGAYLGIGIVIAVAVLTWDGPQRLRRLAPLTLVLCIPGLFATLTRGPIVATGIAVVLVLILSRRRLVALALIFCAVVALVAAWPQIRSSTVYEQRASNVETVLVRQQIQRVSVKLWKERPVLGWGFGSFDRVKNSTDFPYVPGVTGNIYTYARVNTSHDTYLTVLVELGLVGLLLLLTPFAVIVTRALARARLVVDGRWIVAASCGSLIVILLDGTTFDFRFFSFVPALSFVMLALLRRTTGTSSARVAATNPA
jgi:O-antigen ligase